jgi:hypothetical protein
MDLPAFEQAVREAQLRGDHEAIAALARQLEMDELPTLDAGELRRAHMRGAPPGQVTIVFAPADTAPPTYPADLPWLRGINTSLLSLGPTEPVVVFWAAADAGAVAEQILNQSLAQGWVEAPGLKFPTATGARLVFLEREGVSRSLMMVQKGEHGVVQMTQGRSRSAPQP